MNRYRLQRKEPVTRRNYLNGRTEPTHTYRWRDIATSDDPDALRSINPGGENYRIIDTLKGDAVI